MSEKQEQPDSAPDAPQTPQTTEFQIEESGEVSMLEMACLINSILDYYTDESEIDGDDWKKKTGVVKGFVPESVDKEVEKAFVAQLRKFQD